jgi:hypothetical protein
LQRALLHVVEDPGPELNSIADCYRIGVLRSLVGTGQHVQASKYDAAALLSVPVSELVGTTSECQVDGDSNHLVDRINRRWPLEEIFVPVSDFPIRGGRAGDAREGETRSQNVLAVTGARVLGVEGIDQ